MNKFIEDFIKGGLILHLSTEEVFPFELRPKNFFYVFIQEMYDKTKFLKIFALNVLKLINTLKIPS